MINIKFINATSVQLRTVGSPKQIEYTMGSESSPIFSCSNNFFSKDDQNYYYFAISGQNVQLSGQITEVTEDYQFFNLFRDQPAIKDASKLALSAPSVKKFSYANMFLDCQNLTSPPTLSATTLDQWCYSSMFGNCYKLATAPALIATILAKYCYYCMFYNCQSLVTAPYLPARYLADWCYNSMFYNCKNLSCIASQFTAWSPSNATTNWVTRVAQSGWFNNQNITEVYGVDNIPSGWTIEQPQPFIPTISIATLPAVNWDFENASISAINFNSYVTYDGSSTLNYSIVETLPSGVVFQNGVLSANKELMQDDVSETLTLQVSASDVPSTATAQFSFEVSNVEEPQPPVPVGDPLTFTAKETAHIALTSTGTPCAVVLDYSKNGGDWTTYTVGDVIDLASGDTVAFSGANNHFSQNNNNFYRFATTGLVEANGNIQSLMNFSNSCTSGCYTYLFQGNSGLIKAPQLWMRNLDNSCYFHMFFNCNNLSSAPSLPATTLAPACYYGMFRQCSSLINAPALPATDLAKACYYGMFAFTALTSIPTLPATSLIHNCYNEMFMGCTNISSVYLPATSLATACYKSMFKGCTSLNNVEVKFTKWGSSYTTDWLSGTSNSGTFTKSSTLPPSAGYSYIPYGWTVIDK